MNLEELGRRAVACKHWRWMPGMAWFQPPSGAPDDDGDHGRISSVDFDYNIGSPAYPDLSDPATLGCLLALVEEAWRCPVDFSFDGAHWTDLITAEQVWVRDGDHPFEHNTRAGALVAALEAAP